MGIPIFIRWHLYTEKVLWTLYWSEITLCMDSANERWSYIVTSPLIGWTHTQNDLCWYLSVNVYAVDFIPIHTPARHVWCVKKMQLYDNSYLPQVDCPWWPCLKVMAQNAWPNCIKLILDKWCYWFLFVKMPRVRCWCHFSNGCDL